MRRPVQVSIKSYTQIVKLSGRFSGVNAHTNRSAVPRSVAGYSNGSGAKGANGESFQYDEDYHLLLSDTETKLKQLLDSPTRYQPIEKREDRSDIPPSVVETICLGKYITTYRDAPFFREPKELAVFFQFFCLHAAKDSNRAWDIYRIISGLVC